MQSIFEKFCELKPAPDEPPAALKEREKYIAYLKRYSQEESAIAGISWLTSGSEAIVFPYVGAPPIGAQLTTALERLRSGLGALLDIFGDIQKAGFSEDRGQWYFTWLADFAERIGFALSDVLNLPSPTPIGSAWAMYLFWIAQNAHVPYNRDDTFAWILYVLLQYTTRCPHVFFYADWRRNGQPNLRLDGKLAAALIFTNYESGLVDSLNVPWPSFSVAFPDGLLHPFTRVLVQRRQQGSGGWWLCLVSPDGFMALSGRSLGEIAQLKFEGTKMKLPRELRSVTSAALRLFVGILSTLNDSTPHLTQTSSKKKGRPRWLKPNNAPHLDYIVGRDIQVNSDCREHVRAYVEGRTGTLRALRWPVRGHDYKQPYGPGRELRRRIWRQPHFKNRAGADGPMLVRTHVLQSKKSSTG